MASQAATSVSTVRPVEAGGAEAFAETTHAARIEDEGAGPLQLEESKSHVARQGRGQEIAQSRIEPLQMGVIASQHALRSREHICYGEQQQVYIDRCHGAKSPAPNEVDAAPIIALAGLGCNLRQLS